jgi:hypothetical protein
LKVQSLSWGDRQVELVAEKGVGDELGRVAIDKHEHDTPDHLADLVVDKALALNNKLDEFVFRPIKLCGKRDDVTVGLRVLGLEVPRVVVEVVGAHVLSSALIDIL